MLPARWMLSSPPRPITAIRLAPANVPTDLPPTSTFTDPARPPGTRLTLSAPAVPPTARSFWPGWSGSSTRAAVLTCTSSVAGVLVPPSLSVAVTVTVSAPVPANVWVTVVPAGPVRRLVHGPVPVPVDVEREPGRLVDRSTGRWPRG